MGELGSHSPSSPTLPGCFSKDQVYLDGILRILRHRQTIDFPLLAALGKVKAGGRWMSPTPSQSSCGLPWSHFFPKNKPLAGFLSALCMSLHSEASVQQGKAVLGGMRGETGQSCLPCGRLVRGGIIQWVWFCWPLATLVLHRKMTENTNPCKSSVSGSACTSPQARAGFGQGVGGLQGRPKPPISGWGC